MRSSKGQKKQELRRAALEQRESLSHSRVLAWGERIQDRALRHSPYRFSRAVLLYSPIGNEVPTHRICHHALAEAREVFYPKIGNGIGQLGAIKSLKDLVPGRYGILEPPGASPLSTEGRESLVVFVPVVLVDKGGNRIGRGAGWYDRMLLSLGEKATRVALAYEFQLIEEVPAEEWDRPVNFVVTEERVLQCGAEL